MRKVLKNYFETNIIDQQAILDLNLDVPHRYLDDQEEENEDDFELSDVEETEITPETLN